MCDNLEVEFSGANPPDVSVIMPLYNSAQYAVKSIKSVLSQTYKNLELILVDDASIDDTYQQISPFLNDKRVRYIGLTKNSGSAVARNVGIEEARGRYIAFLDSDDLWMPHKVEKQLDFMSQNKFPFTYSAYNKIDRYGQVYEHVGVPDTVEYYDLLKVCSIGCLTAIYDTQHFGKVFMPLIRKRQDLGLWLQLLRRAKYAHGLNEALANYRVHPNSISANKIKAASYTWRLYREHEKLNFISAVYFFSHYAVRGFIRTKMPSFARFLGFLR
ncbi:glycosyltransferase family 2 protein [Idiomarina sp.]|uniref:glycosyltransferase family 2 protein n=1 Tax=Idiomarina sp. TaxID=1874361 RepID=UPI00258F4D99|nr:glycosyltransferase family 2 protein [Idiomarina sp.]